MILRFLCKTIYFYDKHLITFPVSISVCVCVLVFVVDFLFVLGLD